MIITLKPEILWWKCTVMICLFNDKWSKSKNRQSMTAYSLLRLQDVTSNISVKYSEQNSISCEVSKIWKYRVEIGRVLGGLGFYSYIHSLRRAA